MDKPETIYDFRAFNGAEFFEAAAEFKENKPIARENRLYYAEDCSIIKLENVTCDTEAEGNYIIINEDEYSACHQKLFDYSVIEGKMKFAPPHMRTWNMQQSELKRNPYVPGE